MDEPLKRAGSGVLAWIDRDITEPTANFQDPRREWRRLFAELYGTFLLVIVAARGGMMGEAFPNTITRTAAVVAPGLMVMGIIMYGTALGAQNIGIFGAIGVGLVDCAGRLVGQPDLGHVDGSGSHVRPRPGRPRFREPPGPRRRAAHGSSDRGRVRLPTSLRGSGGGRSGSAATQGDFDTEVETPTKA